ncbi:S8 family serine peptidase [Sporosarcina sp. P2]|uniref:S8 family serine peptidase n=1 Tax=Sporosarcina sp. P2 TaxID=2048251 RepID=UPI00117A4678|nr:S8 family serine peptidase [Sporosarcina sp. P2]
MFLFVLLGMLGIHPATGNAEMQGETHSSELLVEYAEGYRSSTIHEAAPGVEKREYITSQVELWSISDEVDLETLQQQLLEEKSISRVEPNYEYRKHSTALSDTYLSQQWWIPHVKSQSIWSNVQQQKKNTIVAVVDSGVDSRHEDLQGRIQSGGYNFTDNNTNITDLDGHGTQVAGVIAATTGNNIGVSGVTGPYNMKILPIKVFDSRGYTSTATLLLAMSHAIDHHVDVINLSLGGPNYSAIFNDSIQRAIQAGISVVASSGNEAEEGNPISYPASYSNVISVGAVDRQNNRAYFSNYNDYVSLVAPGMDIFTTSNYNSYKSVNGTSFSSPIVAGAAALVKSIRPEATPSQIKKMLEDTATDLGSIGIDRYYGRGVLNLEKLNSELAASNPTVPVRGVTLNTNALTINLDKKMNSTSVMSTDAIELEKKHVEAAVDYEREPNNTFATANRLNPGTGMAGAITDYYYDLDHYSFTVDKPGRFSLLASWLESKYVSHLDNQYLRVAIYNSQQKIIGVANLERLSDGTRALYYSDQLEKGTYYLVAFQGSSYKYLFTNERYLISTLFTPDQPVEPIAKPEFLFDNAFMTIGQSRSFVKNVEASAKLTSSVPQVATIDSSGLVRALSRGVTTIRYNSEVAVKEAKVKVTGANSSNSVALFENVLPTNATNQSVTWTSSNQAVAEVDEYGIITGKKSGVAVISVTTNDGSFTANTTVTVVGGEVQPEFKGDFPEMEVPPTKVFTVTFSKDLQIGKDYSEDILISRSENGSNVVKKFTAKVDPTSPNKLLITPTSAWDEGVHYLTIKQNLQNNKLVSLGKNIRMKFDVVSSVSTLEAPDEYVRVLEEVR